MNLPNKLTVFRIVISFFFLIFLFISAHGAKTVALGLFIIGTITDIYDGKLARKLGLTTDFGKLMDPLADKILISSAFISFVQLDPIKIPAWMPALIVIREFGITALRIYALSKGSILSSNRKGKHKMVFQSGTIFIGLIALSWKEIWQLLSKQWNFEWDQSIGLTMWILTFLAVIHTIVTGVYYLWENRNLLIKHDSENI
jgi:CDP-diacylglycerol--glycerol-3-phosphate 3-phosphatidyltransferase